MFLLIMHIVYYCIYLLLCLASTKSTGNIIKTQGTLLPDNFTRPALRDAKDILTGHKELYRGTLLVAPMSLASGSNHVMVWLLLLEKP